MVWLSIGLFLWVAAHLFKRVTPQIRARLGAGGRPIVAASILAGLVLMIIGYRMAEPTPLYSLPFWVWQANNILMFVALVLMDAGRAKGVIRTKIRHPMLAGVLVWAAAHLLVNGDVPSLILFGGLGCWALISMIIINRAEGAWTPPERGRWRHDALLCAIAALLYAVIVGIHAWLGYSVFVLL